MTYNLVVNEEVNGCEEKKKLSLGINEVKSA